MKNRLFLIHLCIFALLLWTVKSLQSAPMSLTFFVNSTADVVDWNPGDGKCETARNNNICTLRAALMEANQNNGVTINLPAGIYKLTIPSTGLDSDSDGALKVRTDTTILGANATSTIVDGNGGVINDRVFNIITPVTQTATISGITIRNGNGTGASGGGIRILCPLTLANCIVTNNTAGRAGGISLYGMGFQPVLTMTNCTVSNNTSSGSASDSFGGGVANVLGVLTINNSTISSNHAACCGGGLYALGSPSQTVVNGGSIAGNFSSGDGGGVYGTATLNGVLIDANTAITNGGRAIAS